MHDQKTSNTHQAIWIALGSLFSMGFGIVSSMILSRYFSKNDYGTYNQVLYVYSTLLTVFSLGLPKAFSYFLPRVDLSEAKSLIKKINLLLFFLGVVFSSLLYLGSDIISDILKNPDLKLALRIFSPVALLMLPTMGLEGILATYRMTKFIAFFTVASRLGMLLCVTVPVVFFKGDYVHAIYGFVIASFITFVLAFYFQYLPVRNREGVKTNTTYSDILKFSFPLLTASLWGILLKSTDQFFISRYFGSEIFAEVANGFTDLPFVGMIVGATATVLSPIFSRMSHAQFDPQRDIYPLWINVFEKSAMLIYPILLFFIVFADVLMIVLYGEKYEVSAKYFRIFNITNFLQIIVFAPLIINIGKVKFYKNVHMFSALLLVPAQFFVVEIFHTPIAIVAISVLFSVSRSLFMLLFVSNFFQIHFLKLFPTTLILKIVLPSVLILIPLHRLLLIMNLEALEMIIYGGLIYVGLFFVSSIIVKLDYSMVLRSILSKD